LHAHLGEVMQETDSDREARLRDLASKLLFTLSKEASRFCLYRQTDDLAKDIVDWQGIVDHRR
jgi:hypothetical protein